MTLRRKHLALLLCVSAFALQVAAIACNPQRYEWDMRAYYYAPRALALGLNPYDLPSLRAVSMPEHAADLQPFIYPPQTLLLFWPLSHLGYGGAFYGYLVFQCLSLAALVWAGVRWLPAPARVWYLLLAPLAFDGALAAGLRTGNVALFEAALLALAAVALAERRWWIFGGLVSVAATFKLVPVVFFLFLLPLKVPRKWAVMAGGAALALLPVVAAFLLVPDLFASFLAHSPAIGNHRAPIDRSLASALRDVLPMTASARSHHALQLAYLALAFGGAAATALTARGLVARGAAEHHIVRLLMLAYIAFSPRLLGYTFALAIAPAVSITVDGPRWRRWSLVAGIALPAAYISRFLFHHPDERPAMSLLGLVWDYWGELAVLAAWAAATFDALTGRPSHADPGSNTEGWSATSLVRPDSGKEGRRGSTPQARWRG